MSNTMKTSVKGYVMSGMEDRTKNPCSSADAVNITTTAPIKRKRSEDSEIEIIDLTESENIDPPRCTVQPSKRGRTSNVAATSTVPDVTRLQRLADVNIATSNAPPKRSPSPPSVATTSPLWSPTQPPPANGLLTPDATPQKKKKKKKKRDIPELADRYVLKISLHEGVEYTDPHKFVLKPAC